VDLKRQINLNKITYWNNPLTMRDAVGSPVDAFHYSSADFTLGLNFIIHYSLSNNIVLGSGVGSRVLLYSHSRAPLIPNSDDSKHYSNGFYKTIMPTIPVEISYKLKRTMFTVRYEQALLNRYRNDLKDYQSEKYGLLFFEIGFSL